jgi:ABC-2 type transport system permease protein
MFAAVLSAIGLVLASLTGRRAFATGAVAIFFLLTYTLAEILLQVESQATRGGPAFGLGVGGPPAVPLAEKVAGLFSPFTLFDGVRMWIGGASHHADNVADPGGFGAAYALVLLILFGLCLYGLAARYRKARLS